MHTIKLQWKRSIALIGYLAQEITITQIVLYLKQKTAMSDRIEDNHIFE